MKKSLAILALPLSLSLSQIANAAPNVAPSTCPTPKAIQAIGLKGFTAEIASTGLWISVNLAEQYGTNDYWTFALGNIKANSVEDAKTKALKGLSSIKLVEGPEPGPLHRWICRYTTEEGYIAAALNPPVFNNFNNFLQQ